MKNDNFLFFWGHRAPPDGRINKSCLSQWYDCHFVENGVSYHTAEQYMMASKARLFGDASSVAEIMSAATPREYKRLGRHVRNFDASVWEAKRFDIVVMGNYHKFSQNKDLGQFLLSTGDKVLVEASPYDTIWGIGMSADDSKITDPGKWRGQNLLGIALMTVRDLLKKEI